MKKKNKNENNKKNKRVEMVKEEEGEDGTYAEHKAHAEGRVCTSTRQSRPNQAESSVSTKKSRPLLWPRKRSRALLRSIYFLPSFSPSFTNMKVTWQRPQY